MVISQNARRRVNTSSARIITWVSVIAAKVEHNENYLVIGQFETIRRAEEVLREIEEAHKRGEPTFLVPKE